MLCNFQVFGDLAAIFLLLITDWFDSLTVRKRSLYGLNSSKPVEVFFTGKGTAS